MQFVKQKEKYHAKAPQKSLKNLDFCIIIFIIITNPVKNGMKERFLLSTIRLCKKTTNIHSFIHLCDIFIKYSQKPTNKCIKLFDRAGEW